MTRTPLRRLSATTPAPGDLGAILAISLLLVVVFGMVAAAMATYGAATFRHHRVVRLQAELRSGAEASLRVGLDRIRLHSSLCIDSPVGSVTTLAPIVGSTLDPTTMTCSPLSGVTGGANEWGAVLTGIGTSPSAPLLTSTGSSTQSILVDGPVYLGDSTTATDPEAIHSPVTIDNGDLWIHDSTCADEGAALSAPSGLRPFPSPPRTAHCTKAPWTQIAPAPTLPPIPTASNPAARDDLVPGCRVFFPGHYSAAPTLLAGSNYFVSGNYYFDFGGSFDIRQADVLGGRPDTRAADSARIPGLSPSCAEVSTTEAVVDAEQGFGVSWILGGNARIAVGDGARVELFSRATTDDVYVSLQASDSDAGGYHTSSITATDAPILSVAALSTDDVVLHGLVHAPRARVALGLVNSSASPQTAGGLVAAALDLTGSTSPTAWTVGRADRPTGTRLSVSSVTQRDGVTFTVSAIVGYRLGRAVVDGQTTLAGAGDGTFDFRGLHSDTAVFSSADIGNVVVAPGLPARTTVVSVLSPTDVVLSAPATDALTGLTVMIRTAEVTIESWSKR